MRVTAARAAGQKQFPGFRTRALGVVLVAAAVAAQPVISAQLAGRRARTVCQPVLARDEKLAARTGSSAESRVTLVVPRPIDLALLGAGLGIAADSPSFLRTEEIAVEHMSLNLLLLSPAKKEDFNTSIYQARRGPARRTDPWCRTLS